MRRRDSHDAAGGGGPAGEAGVASPLPVFLFPSELLFYSDQRSSHRRVLTLYNPYSFRISFKMWCTAPSLYRVVEAEGSVAAKSCVDLVVRHLDVSPQNWGRRDRFRMEVRGGAERRRGRRGGEEERKIRRREAEEADSSAGTDADTPAAAHLYSCAQCVSVGGVCAAGCSVCHSVDAPPEQRQQLRGSTMSPRVHQSEAGLRLHTGSSHHGVSTLTSVTMATMEPGSTSKVVRRLDDVRGFTCDEVT
ncbi:uncharacterized protein LOC121640500 isoform X1 [Melanotaenia boesemani]|uniref:uncharacterized protein LOC121640500 isoform X1 n=1 Tax=Melanotaenia boesemani TaxID=1250792 RepID=UPI001C05C677|nr:uncharacterized protein LOC121640500 isoform X1 [Melanotaenia boesemani]XP_041842238.1 uncharacterized protein LOC121640500 isoform X1 [Melanotaenia boesemani]